MPSRIELEVGQRFGRLTAMAFVRKDKGRPAIWRFRCECGNTHETQASSVMHNLTRSCGCLRRETGATAGRGRATHRMARSPEYEAWNSMIQRCTNPNAQAFQQYGGRGIKVFDLWRTFENFLADMGPRPSPKHSIDRINNDGNYEPGNCRWATRKEQQRNMRNNRMIVVDGVSMMLVEAVERAGLDYMMVYGRLYRGWDISRALSK